MILTLTCTFGRSFPEREIVITHEGGRPTTTNLPIAITPVNCLSNVNATYTSAAVQYTVQLVTSRAIKNLAFICIGRDYANRNIFSSTKMLNIKCKDMC